MIHDTLETPAGPLTVSSDGTCVREIALGVRRRDGSDAITRIALCQLAQYFRGRRTRFDLPFRLDKPAFTTAVLDYLARIPFGQTLSYGEVAQGVGRPRAARAVGQAMGSNPLPILIPCHRVLAAHKGLGGFGAGLSWKRILLGLEGAGYREAVTAMPSSRA